MTVQHTDPAAEPTEADAPSKCACFTAQADCSYCRSCLLHHDLDDCDNWAEWAAEGWY